MATADRHKSFAELREAEPEGTAYRCRAIQRQSGFAIIAPHGGGIEPGTTEIAQGIAGSRFSLYTFEGLKPNGNETLHITSTLFDEPECLQLVNASEVAIAIHGCSGDAKTIYLGGLHDELKIRLIDALVTAGFDARPAGHNYAGRQPQNICNRGRSGCGVQIEISESLRRAMFKGLGRRDRKITTDIFRKFISSVHMTLITAAKEIGL